MWRCVHAVPSAAASVTLCACRAFCCCYCGSFCACEGRSLAVCVRGRSARSAVVPVQLAVADVVPRLC